MNTKLSLLARELAFEWQIPYTGLHSSKTSGKKSEVRHLDASVATYTGLMLLVRAKNFTCSHQAMSLAYCESVSTYFLTCCHAMHASHYSPCSAGHQVVQLELA